MAARRSAAEISFFFNVIFVNVFVLDKNFYVKHPIFIFIFIFDE